MKQDRACGAVTLFAAVMMLLSIGLPWYRFVWASGKVRASFGGFKVFFGNGLFVMVEDSTLMFTGFTVMALALLICLLSLDAMRVIPGFGEHRHSRVGALIASGAMLAVSVYMVKPARGPYAERMVAGPGIVVMVFASIVAVLGSAALLWVGTPRRGGVLLPARKKCPFCAEYIRTEAIRCRYCRSDLVGYGAPGGACARAPESGVPRW